MKICNGRNNEHLLMPQVNDLFSLFRGTEKFTELFKSLNIERRMKCLLARKISLACDTKFMTAK